MGYYLAGGVAKRKGGRRVEPPPDPFALRKEVYGPGEAGEGCWSHSGGERGGCQGREKWVARGVRRQRVAAHAK